MQQTTRMVTVTMILGTLLLPAIALAGGFAINEVGTKAVGMGGAFAAQADDPSAVFYNPAGIVQLEGTQVSAGAALIAPQGRFRSSTTDNGVFMNYPGPPLSPAIPDGTPALIGTFPGKITEQCEETHVIPNAFVTHQYDDQWSFGVGTFSNFGLCSEWPDDWEGRFVIGGVKAGITSLVFNPVVAYRPWKRLSLAAGPFIQYMDIELKNRFYTGPGGVEPLVEFSDSTWGWGANVGVLLWLSDNVKLGASYRTRVEQDFSGGDVRFFPEVSAAGLDNTSFDAEITLPDEAFVGISWVIDNLTLEFDIQWTGWSSYEELTAIFSDPVAAQNSLSVDKQWEDVVAYRFGAQLKINDHFDLRGGIIYDEAPQPDETLDPLVPSGDRWLYTVGAGFHYKRWTFDLAYNYLQDEGRIWNNDVGDYFTGLPLDPTPPPTFGRVTGSFEDLYAHIGMFSLSYRF